MPTKQKNLIVYFPGYTGMPKSRFNPLLRRFRKDGFKTYSVKYDLFGRDDIVKTAQKTVNQIQKLDFPQYDAVTFIGHSMGGLVARKVACSSTVVPDYLVTLGSPHRGTQAASRPFAWLGGKSVVQMRAESEFLLSCGYPDIPTLAVTGKYDYLVRDGRIESSNGVGPDKYKLEHQVKNIEVPTTHIGLITNHRTYGEIYSWLVYEQLDRLVP